MLGTSSRKANNGLKEDCLAVLVGQRGLIKKVRELIRETFRYPIGSIEEQATSDQPLIAVDLIENSNSAEWPVVITIPGLAAAGTVSMLRRSGIPLYRAISRARYYAITLAYQDPNSPYAQHSESKLELLTNVLPIVYEHKNDQFVCVPV